MNEFLKIMNKFFKIKTNKIQIVVLEYLTKLLKN